MNRYVRTLAALLFLWISLAPLSESKNRRFDNFKIVGTNDPTTEDHPWGGDDSRLAAPKGHQLDLFTDFVVRMAVRFWYPRHSMIVTDTPTDTNVTNDSNQSGNTLSNGNVE